MKMGTFRLNQLCFCVVAFASGLASAREYHLTTDGAGNRDGRSWENASPKTKLTPLLADGLEAGDTVLIGSGVYSWRPEGSNTLLVIGCSGVKENPITIKGVDTGEGLPMIQGKWSERNARYHAHSATAINLDHGASHLRFSNLKITGFMHGFHIAGGGNDVTIEGIEIRKCREGIRIEGLRDSEVRDCRLVGYTKRGIRFSQNCEDLTISHVTADANGGEPDWPTESFPFGFSIESDQGNRRIRFERCVARNNLHQGKPDDYWNGDGFVAESLASEISYFGCEAYDNMDGGFDDKSLAPVFVNCVAVRNKRSFRCWNVRGDEDHPARLNNCLAVNSYRRGGSGGGTGLWMCGVVDIEKCTFHNGESCAVDIDQNGWAARLTARNCIFSSDRLTKSTELVKQESGTQCQTEGVVMWIEKVSGEDPQYVAPNDAWMGTPRTAYDSRRYEGAKGYGAPSRDFDYGRIRSEIMQ